MIVYFSHGTNSTLGGALEKPSSSHPVIASYRWLGNVVGIEEIRYVISDGIQNTTHLTGYMLFRFLKG